MNATRRVVTYDLFGWKEIADFLGVARNTAMHYADTQELPVSWFNSRVRARSDDLDQWLAGRLRHNVTQ